ncbi:tripartite tricarboxylate transporter substrate-binding protein [Falsiroseomonas sp. HW251]|uniref:tripartite tricarboxylate transporter substrate-binding protein n=1 Tax=Falsiroseomonas sp. HW251 TaxID=3390998 RepID=UPI003D3148DF
MSARTTQPVVVENRAGAGGVIGSEYVATSTDGRTLIFMTLSAAVLNQALQQPADRGCACRQHPHASERRPQRHLREAVHQRGG